jgi:hypothetical protein
VKTQHDAHLRLAAFACTLGLLASGCDQPAPRCTVAPGDFAVKYTIISGNCDPLPGETLSLQVYYPPRSRSDSSPNFEKATIGLQPSSLTAMVGDALHRGSAALEGDKPYGLGAFASGKPGGDDYCQVPDLTLARVRLPALPEFTECGVTSPAQEAMDVSYKFSQVRVYNTPGAYGTQLDGVLTYTTPTCTSTYRVVGIYPAVACNTSATPAPDSSDAGAADEGGVAPPAAGDGGAEEDAGEAPELEEGCEEPPPDPGPQVPDDTLCGAGSGISPEFAVTCDPALLMCVLANEPPSLR